MFRFQIDTLMLSNFQYYSDNLGIKVHVNKCCQPRLWLTSIGSVEFKFISSVPVLELRYTVCFGYFEIEESDLNSSLYPNFNTQKPMLNYTNNVTGHLFLL